MKKYKSKIIIVRTNKITHTRWLRINISLLFVVLLIAGYCWIQNKTDYFVAGWSSLILGTILLAFGSFVLASPEWILPGLTLKTGRKVTCLIFAIAIAAGGTLTTRGWKQLDNHDHKNTLILAISRELLLNETTLIAIDDFLSKDDEELAKPLLLPIISTDTASLVFKSGVFNEKDKELLKAIFEYKGIAISLNTLLSKIDDITTMVISKEQRVRNYNSLKTSVLLKKFRDEHKKMKDILLESYKSSITTGIDWAQ